MEVPEVAMEMPDARAAYYAPGAVEVVVDRLLWLLEKDREIPACLQTWNAQTSLQGALSCI
jgi:hypothetical protein